MVSPKLLCCLIALLAITHQQQQLLVLAAPAGEGQGNDAVHAEHDGGDDVQQHAEMAHDDQQKQTIEHASSERKHNSGSFNQQALVGSSDPTMLYGSRPAAIGHEYVYNPSLVNEQNYGRNNENFVSTPIGTSISRDKQMDKLKLKIRELFNRDGELNLSEIWRVLNEYKSDQSDWLQYAHCDEHKYTRNLVDEGNGKYNLMILCWGPGIGSSIHDHSASQCFVKVLEGKILETRFAWPAPGKERYNEGEAETNDAARQREHDDEREMRNTETKVLGLNGVSYINDTMGLHRMENHSHVDRTITLHLYIPPYNQCHSFDQRTGLKQQSTVEFYSKYGMRTDYRSEP